MCKMLRLVVQWTDGGQLRNLARFKDWKKLKNLSKTYRKGGGKGYGKRPTGQRKKAGNAERRGKECC